jgi:NAD(P)-dependent dehydrogenase (short-subunit alcohol dehydrogenase family)
MREGRVESKVAIVTGAQQGIGFEIAKILIQEGAFVVLTDIEAKRFSKNAFMERASRYSGK